MMEVSESLSQMEQLHLMSEKRKWQTEVENKRRELEEDRRTLQHLKSKALRERWLLDGAPSAGPEHDEVRRKLEEDEAKTKSLEVTINRLEQELVSLETGAVCQTVTHTTEISGPVTEVKGHTDCQQDTEADSGLVISEPPTQVKVHKSPRMNKPRETTDDMKRAMYSVQITVERDRLTGETRVLSSNTTLPVDVDLQGVKVYEDERKVIHEVNGEDGGHLLSSSEVEELLHKADEASMMSQTVTTATSLPMEEVQEQNAEEAEEAKEAEEASSAPPRSPAVAVEITGLEAEGQRDVGGAGEEEPVTMVFMGYQSVEDEEETRKVLGLQGTVRAELVLLHDPSTSPQEEVAPPPVSETPPRAAATATPTVKTPPTVKAPPTTTTAPTTRPPEPVMEKNGGAGESVGESVGEVSGGEVAVKKEKPPCKCCNIM